MLNKKITAVVLESTDAELRRLTSLLRGFPEISVLSKATNGEQGLALIYNYVPDWVFMDVDLPGINGFEIAHIMHKRNYYPEIIFTAHDDKRAYDSLELKPFDFLVKPVEREDIEKLIERYKLKVKKAILNRKINGYAKNMDLRNKRVFPVKKGIIVLKLDEIVFCRASLSKTVLTLVTGEEIKLGTGFSETNEIINDENFLKMSRSHCVNRNYLWRINKKANKCILVHNEKKWEVPVSRSSLNAIEKLITHQVL